MCFRKQLASKWQKEYLTQTSLVVVVSPSIHTILMRARVRWADHFACMTDIHWLPERLFYSELQQGKHSKEGQRKQLQGRSEGI